MKLDEISIVVRLVYRVKAVELDVSPGQVEELFRISRSLHRIAEQDCNVGLSDREQKRETRLMKRANAVAAELGATAYFQGDPRGAALYLIFPGDVPEGRSPREFYTNGIAIY
jgi:hypothetical protein